MKTRYKLAIKPAFFNLKLKIVNLTSKILHKPQNTTDTEYKCEVDRLRKVYVFRSR